MSRNNPDNSRLALMSQLTSFGDWFTHFALLVYIFKTTNNVLLAAYTVPLRSLAVAISALSIPKILSKFSLRVILTFSQVISGILTCLVIFCLLVSKNVTPFLILSVVFIVTLLKQYFDVARESYSKRLAQEHSHRSLQAQILQGLYSAQFLAPLLVYLVLLKFPLYVAMSLDAISFFIAALLSLTMQDDFRTKVGSVFAPLKYLQTDPDLRAIFIIRAILFWIPISLFNYFLFSIVTMKYKLGIENSTLIYSMTGLGSYISATWLRAKKTRILKHLHSLSDAKLAFFACVLAGGTYFGFLKLSSFTVTLAIIFVFGIANGINAVATQSLRRKLTSDAQFPEIVALESLVARCVDFAIPTLFMTIQTAYSLRYESGVYIGIALTLPLALSNLSQRLISK